MVNKSVEITKPEWSWHRWAVRIKRGEGSSVYFPRRGSPSIIRLLRVMLNIAEREASNG